MHGALCGWAELVGVIEIVVSPMVWACLLGKIWKENSMIETAVLPRKQSFYLTVHFFSFYNTIFVYIFHRFCTLFSDNDPFLVIFETFCKNPRICLTGLETGCKPVLLFLLSDHLLITVFCHLFFFYFFCFVLALIRDCSLCWDHWDVVQTPHTHQALH